MAIWGSGGFLSHGGTPSYHRRRRVEESKTNRGPRLCWWNSKLGPEATTLKWSGCGLVSRWGNGKIEWLKSWENDGKPAIFQRVFSRSDWQTQPEMYIVLHSEPSPPCCTKGTRGSKWLEQYPSLRPAHAMIRVMLQPQLQAWKGDNWGGNLKSWHLADSKDQILLLHTRLLWLNIFISTYKAKVWMHDINRNMLSPDWTLNSKLPHISSSTQGTYDRLPPSFPSLAFTQTSTTSEAGLSFPSFVEAVDRRFARHETLFEWPQNGSIWEGNPVCRKRSWACRGGSIGRSTHHVPPVTLICPMGKGPLAHCLY